MRRCRAAAAVAAAAAASVMAVRPVLSVGVLVRLSRGVCPRRLAAVGGGEGALVGNFCVSNPVDHVRKGALHKGQRRSLVMFVCGGPK